MRSSRGAEEPIAGQVSARTFDETYANQDIVRLELPEPWHAQLNCLDPQLQSAHLPGPAPFIRSVDLPVNTTQRQRQLAQAEIPPKRQLGPCITQTSDESSIPIPLYPPLLHNNR